MGYSSLFPESGETTSQNNQEQRRDCRHQRRRRFLDRGWTGTGGNPMGFIIHDGEVVYDQHEGKGDVKQETVAFTKEGMLIGKYTGK